VNILWVLALYDEDKQLFDKTIVQMGSDLQETQVDMAEQMADIFFSFQDNKENDDEGIVANLDG
jgi:hypothetical protein